jgi:hypothetical protein
MSYRPVKKEFFAAITDQLPTEWKVESGQIHCTVVQWFEPVNNEMIAQSVTCESDEPSLLLHDSYAILDPRGQKMAANYSTL